MDNKKNWKRLAAAVLLQAYTDIKKAETNKFKNKKNLGVQLLHARSVARFLKSEEADFYRSFFQGE